MLHQKLADSTFRIVCGNSSGSGFSFITDRLVLTNHHVIEPYLDNNAPIQAITESNVALPARLMAYSHKSIYDFAILQLQVPLPAGRIVLQPAANPITDRGERILFAGFPHGIPHLLVHEAVVSAPCGPKGFYIDGSINGGNSGGPIVSAASGEVLGIVTQRRFIGGAQLDKLGPQVDQIAQHCKAMAKGGGGVAIMGVDFGAYATMMAEGFGALSEVIAGNANCGIGIGFKIGFANDEIRLQNLAKP